MSLPQGQASGQSSRRVYSIQTLLRFGQKAGCLGLHTLRLSPDIPWAHVLKFANMERRARLENPLHRPKSDGDQEPYAKTRSRQETSADSKVEIRPRFTAGLDGQAQAIREPDNPPFSESLQRVMGFAKFLKTHTSPQDKRVTAGGRIVPVGPKSPPPTFQVEHLETVLRTAEKNQRQFKVSSSLGQDKTKHSDSKEMPKMFDPATHTSATTTNVSKGDEVEHQQLGWLKLDKSFRLLEQLSLGTAIVKLGAAVFHASTGGPCERVHFQTVTVQQPQPHMHPRAAAVNANVQLMGNPTWKTSLDAPMTDQAPSQLPVMYQAGDRQFQQMLPHNESLSIAEYNRVHEWHEPLQIASTGPSGDFGNVPTGHLLQGGHQHEWTNSSSSQAKTSDEFLNSRFSAIPMDAWSTETLSALRTATEAYMQACSFLKEHEKYTALNESHMSSQELQFAIEKKRHLILARDACRQRKDSLEATQAEQLQRLRDLENQHLEHMQTTQLVQHVGYDGASVHNPPHECVHHGSTRSETARTTKHPQQLPVHFNKPAKQFHKSLSPRAPEFFPGVSLPAKSLRQHDEGSMYSSLWADAVDGAIDAAAVETTSSAYDSRLRRGSELTILRGSVERNKRENNEHSMTPDEVRKALQTPEKGPMELEQEAAQVQTLSLRGDTSDIHSMNRAKFYFAAQARRSEKSLRRSKLSSRGSIAEVSGKMLAALALQQKKSPVPAQDHETAADTSQPQPLKRHSETSSGSDWKYDEVAKLFKKDKNQARFGIDDCLAAFENANHTSDVIDDAARKATSPAEATGMAQRSSQKAGKNKPKMMQQRGIVPQAPGSTVASEVEKRVSKEQQKIVTYEKEHRGSRMMPVMPANLLTPKYKGSHVQPRTPAKVTAHQSVEDRTSAQHFSPVTPPGGATSTLRSSLAMDARLRGGLLGASGGNFMSGFYGDMDQGLDMTTSRRLDLSRRTATAAQVNRSNNRSNICLSSGDYTPAQPRGLPVPTETMSRAWEDYRDGQPADFVIQFPMADPNQLPLSIYREPYRPYTPDLERQDGQFHHR